MRSAAWSGSQPVTQRFDDPCCREAYAAFGYRGHNGVDIGCWTGTAVFAMRPATVQWSGYDASGYGNLVVVRHDGDGCCWYYAHLQTRLVATGQAVAAGTLLGSSDNTGNSSGPHLHLGQRPAGADPGNGFGGFVDPVPYLVATNTWAPPPAPPAPSPEAVAVLQDWQIINWILVEYYRWAGLRDAFNPDAAHNKAWVAELRAGRYRGRPRTAERPYGGDAPEGTWQEWEGGTSVYRAADGAVGWDG